MESKDPTQPKPLPFAEMLSKEDFDQFQSLGLTLFTEQPSDVDKHQVILIRHAYSMYNYTCQKVKKEKGITDTDTQAKEYRLSKELVDPPLHKYGVYQAIVASELINNLNFQVVFSSPMRRALQTTQILFRNYLKTTGQQLKVIVFPLFTQVLNTTNDVSPETLTQVREEFQKDENLTFDFTLMDNFKNQFIWQAENIHDDELRKTLEDKLSQHPYTLDGQLDGAIETFEHYFPLRFQSKPSIYIRSRKAIGEFKQFLETQYPEIEKSAQIAIVSHHTFINTLLSDGCDQNKKLIGGYDMQNCELKPHTF